MSQIDRGKKVLFICSHNSARSQMAEGLLQRLYGDLYEAHSAGLEPSSVNPYAIEVMGEIGIDISTHRSKNVDEFLGIQFDCVITVCDQAREACPFFHGGEKHLHKGFEDPAELSGTEGQTLTVFRRVRDEIKSWIEETFGGEGVQMDWNTPQGILRRGMSLERDGYNFYTQAAERASGERGKAMFLDLAAQEEQHLRLLLAEYQTLEEGRGWLPHEEAMQTDFPLDPANPDLPGEEPPEPMPVFTPGREISLEGDIAALEFGLETERISRELYAQAAQETDDPQARQTYEFLTGQEEEHYRLLQNTHEYLTQNQTWWDSEELPFFTG